MAYQNVGTPRFYINVPEWANSVNATIPWGASSIEGNTYAGSEENISRTPEWGYEPLDYPEEVISRHFYTLPIKPGFINAQGICVKTLKPYTYSPNGFAAFLGHTFNSQEMPEGRLRFLDNYFFPNDTWNYNSPHIDFTNIINGDNEYNGFSIVKFDWDSFTQGLHMDFQIPDTGGYVGAIILGSFYDMPHSVENLNLTMSREMDGVKKIRTKGGSDLVNYKYINPPSWGTAGAWELYSGTLYTTDRDENYQSYISQKIRRSGRRVWDLSFNYLDGGDVFGPHQSISDLYSLGATDYYGYPEHIDTTGIDTTDLLYSGSDHLAGFKTNLLTDNNFFSQVIHKTNGGQLAFLFNPVGGGSDPDNSPQNFAICKFDMKSFQFNQVANGIYSIKLKIREIW